MASVVNPDVTVLRRPIYDIVLQLKAEADAEINQNAQFLSSMQTNDRQSGVYEGGLKTWEGAFDLARLITTIDFQEGEHSWHIIELGAGSAVPAMIALNKILNGSHRDRGATNAKSFHFTLSDFNDEVLRLSTYANVILASKAYVSGGVDANSHDNSTGEEADHLDIENNFIRDCQKLWDYVRISFNFISGPWGREFEVACTDVAEIQDTRLLILASETIYDLESLAAFTDTMVNLLHRHGARSKAWVAAKKLYFGVGGGVDAFIDQVESRGGIVNEILRTKEGVSRVVLEVTMPEE